MAKCGRKRLDYAGQVFGTWMIVQRVGLTSYWCECIKCGARQSYACDPSNFRRGRCFTCKPTQRNADYSSARFGPWCVCERNRKRPTHWDCICRTCGRLRTIPYMAIVTNRPPECRTCTPRRNDKDERGKRYGRLKVLDDAGLYDGKYRLWRSRCDCGTIKNVLGYTLRLGRVRSCGCLGRKAIQVVVEPTPKQTRRNRR